MADDPHTRGRFDRKFLIKCGSRRDIELFLKMNRLMFSETFYERRVNNIYFDTSDRMLFENHLEGIECREKFRLRWYGNLFGHIRLSNLEIKEKKNLLTYKKSWKMSPFKFTQKTVLSKLKRKFIMQSDLPSLFKERLHILSPSLLNTYIRKYYVSYDKKYRITIDDQLTYYKISPGNYITFIPYVEKNTYILELKYDSSDDDDAHLIFGSSPFVLEKHSKYLAGINLIENRL